MIVSKVKSKNKQFYAVVGPYLANRNVAKEIGYHIYDDENTEWFIALSGGELAAFANCRVSGNSVNICSCYTIEQFRLKGAMRSIVQYIKSEYQGKLLRVSANANSKPLFASEGFKVVRKNGSFTVMEHKNA